MNITAVDICALSREEQETFEKLSPINLAANGVSNLAQASLLSYTNDEDYEVACKLVADCLSSSDLLGEERVKEIFEEARSNFECIYHYDVLHDTRHGAQTYKVSSYRSLSDAIESDKELLIDKLGIEFNSVEDELTIYLEDGHVDFILCKPSSDETNAAGC